MSKKFKVTVMAIVATLTFATTAFAGLFNVVGAVVGGVLGVPMTASQEQLENFHKSYLEKSATRILETGSVDTAFNEMVEQQRGIGCNVKVSEPDADHKIADISGGNLQVIVKCLVNKKDQTITISYTKPDGVPTGNVLTKKYELPAGSTVKTADSSLERIDVAPSEKLNLNEKTNNPNNPDIKNKFAQPPLLLKDKTSMKNCCMLRNDYIPNNKTGCSSFDSSKAIERPLYVFYAYRTAKGGNWIDHIDALADKEMKSIKDPFSAPKLKAAVKDLIAYYKAGNMPNVGVINLTDYLYGDVNEILRINNSDKLYDDTYSLKRQVYTINPRSSYLLINDRSYNINIPQSEVEKAYNTLNAIITENKKSLSKIHQSKGSNVPKQKITVIRICQGADTICDYNYVTSSITYRNGYFSVKTMEGFVSLANNKEVYTFENSTWKDLISASQSNCVVTNFD